MCQYSLAGDAAAMKKSEEELARKQSKENQEPASKRRKESQKTKTPCRKSTKQRRRPLGKIQAPEKPSSTPDFELRSPAPGSSPPSAKADTSPLKEKKDLDVSLSGFSTDGSTSSEGMLPPNALEKVITIFTDDDEPPPHVEPLHEIVYTGNIYEEQWDYHHEILQKLETLTSAVNSLDSRLLTVLSHLADIKSH
jgi:hypothetical protein